MHTRYCMQAYNMLYAKNLILWKLNNMREVYTRRISASDFLAIKSNKTFKSAFFFIFLDTTQYLIFHVWQVKKLIPTEVGNMREKFTRAILAHQIFYFPLMKYGKCFGFTCKFYFYKPF
jgi:hypothetical protein